MQKIVIIEGSRGTGKSTLAFQLRQSLKNSTLINFTGFNLDGEEGLRQISEYYYNWMTMFHAMKMGDINQTFICDRIFFTEMVFSPLYKTYDFSKTYNELVNLLEMLNPTIIYLTCDDEKEILTRLERDKIPFYNVDESVKETMRQQQEYDKIFKEMENKFNIVNIDTTYLTTVQVKDLVLSKI